MNLTTKKQLILLVFSSLIFICRSTLVSTPKGKIVGSENLRTRNGRVIYSFTAIPYARPPVGDLRFQVPQPTDPWQGSFDATKNGPECIQIDHFLMHGSQGPLPTLGQEDCLVLNVYSPKVDSAAKLPVMVYIHGGGFVQGSSARIDYGPEFLLDKDIVLVTLNYRLGVLGFLMTGDDVIPGNIGMKDQAFALRWVHDNIESFGGDPDLVTIFGESAGGGSTHLNLLSPLNKGLIHRAIAMSGSGLCPWSVRSAQLAIDRTKALAVLSGCPPEPSEALLKCLQSIPAEYLLKNGKKFQEWLMAPPVVFGPAIEPKSAENAFLQTHPREISSDVPLMAGITSGEGGIFASALFGKQASHFETDLKESPQEILPRLLMLSSEFPEDTVSTIAETIQRFYFGEKPIDRNSTQGIVNMITDSWFLHGAIETVSKHEGNAYLYYYDYEHSVSFNSIFGTGELKGVCHSDSLLNLFPMSGTIPGRPFSQRDVRVSESVVDLWTNFAKYGKPAEDAIFKDATSKQERPNKYLHITADGPVVRKNLLPERVEFWKSLKKLRGTSKSDPEHLEL